VNSGLSPADIAHRQRVTHIHLAAARQFGCTLGQVRHWGWYDRSLSGSATRDGQKVWVRTVTEQPQWAEAPFWVGNTEANKVADIPKPVVLDWTEHHDDDRWFRTEVMTYVDQDPASQTPAITTPPSIDDAWLTQLQHAIDALETSTTERVSRTQDEVTQTLREYFGDRIDPEVQRWSASHCDLHWANLTAPTLVILDWEQWGLAPYGYDIATLYCHSLLVPETAATIRHRFTRMLDSPDGRRSQLLAIARMLSRTRMGDYTNLVVPLHRLADEILGR